MAALLSFYWVALDTLLPHTNHPKCLMQLAAYVLRVFLHSSIVLVVYLCGKCICIGETTRYAVNIGKCGFGIWSGAHKTTSYVVIAISA